MRKKKLGELKNLMEESKIEGKIAAELGYYHLNQDEVIKYIRAKSY